MNKRRCLSARVKSNGANSSVPFYQPSCTSFATAHHGLMIFCLVLGREEHASGRVGAIAAHKRGAAMPFMIGALNPLPLPALRSRRTWGSHAYHKLSILYCYHGPSFHRLRKKTADQHVQNIPHDICHHLDIRTIYRRILRFSTQESRSCSDALRAGMVDSVRISVVKM